MVILDTNIIIDQIRQRPGKSTVLKSLLKRVGHKSLAISSVSIQELYTGQSTRHPHNKGILLQTLKVIKVFSLTPSIARITGELMRDSTGKLQFADAAIAATALYHQAELATLNTKDFSEIPHLKLFRH